MVSPAQHTHGHSSTLTQLLLHTVTQGRQQEEKDEVKKNYSLPQHSGRERGLRSTTWRPQIARDTSTLVNALSQNSPTARFPLIPAFLPMSVLLIYPNLQNYYSSRPHIRSKLKRSPIIINLRRL